MKLKLLLASLLYLDCCIMMGQEKFPTGLNKQSLPEIVFTQNKGQVHDQNHQSRPDVLYGSMTGNMAVHIKKTGVSYQLYRVDHYKEVEDLKTKEKRKEIAQQTIYRVDLNWVNANINFVRIEDEDLPGYNNYYLENCPNGALGVNSYKGVTLKNIFNGIDLHYYEKNGELKHDYLVAAHTDYEQIHVKVDGAEITINEDGSLLFNTPLGKIQEGKPIVFQNGKILNASWKIDGNILSFKIEDYNPNYPLIIDPVTRLWGTYYGGSAEERGLYCSTDPSSNVYLSGYTSSNTGTIIATVGSHQTVSGGSVDAFLAKFDNLGIRLWSTYYGGTGFQFGNSCAADQAGNVYMAGSTSSGTGTVIATAGCHQPSYGGGSNDAYIVKFNSNGIRQWGTYYGGSNSDDSYSCALDASGNVYLAGYSNSTNSIANPGSHQTANAGSYDGFLVKFNTNGIRQWGTYYGGSGLETGFSCSTDISGNVYLAGSSNTSTTGIATIGSHQPVYGGGGSEGYLVKFNQNGIRQWGTYYGGNIDDIALSCATDGTGNVLLAGYSTSSSGNAIATLGSHQAVYAGGTSDGFLAKFDGSGIRLWGTYYGGAGEEQAYACSVDINNNIYITGFTDSNSGNSIATVGSQQPSFGGGIYDAFLTKFDGNGIRQWGSYYGGATYDKGQSCALDVNGILYVSGFTNSNTGIAIATIGSHQSTFGGGTYDGFLAKFDVCDVAPLQPTAILGNTITCSGSGSSTYSIANVSGATSYTWSLPAGWSGSSNTNSISATPGASGVFTVVAGNACGASPQQNLNVTVNPLPVITVSTNISVLCEGESATLTASGASTYTFNPGGTGTSIVVTPPVTSVYTVSGTNANGCSNTFIFTQNVDACLGINSNNAVTSSGVEMYPNPTEGKINLELSSNYEVTIINSLGQVVHEAKLNNGKHELDLVHLAKGLYVVKVSGGNGSRTVKMIKE